MTRASRVAIGLAVWALAAASIVLGAGEDEKTGKTGALPRKAATPEGAQGGTADMSRSPAPVSGSMPKSAAPPTGKLGTEPTARGRLGTDPKPDETGSRPPRLN